MSVAVVDELVDGPERPDWYDEARCRDAGVDFFARNSDDEALALALCAECGVRPQCLVFARRHRVEEGVWGGLTEAQRRRRPRRLGPRCGCGGTMRREDLVTLRCRACGDTRGVDE